MPSGHQFRPGCGGRSGLAVRRDERVPSEIGDDARRQDGRSRAGEGRGRFDSPSQRGVSPDPAYLPEVTLHRAPHPTIPLDALLSESADLEAALLALRQDGAARILREMRLRLADSAVAQAVADAARTMVEDAWTHAQALGIREEEADLDDDLWRRLRDAVAAWRRTRGIPLCRLPASARTPALRSTKSRSL